MQDIIIKLLLFWINIPLFYQKRNFGRSVSISWEVVSHMDSSGQMLALMSHSTCISY